MKNDSYSTTHVSRFSNILNGFIQKDFAILNTENTPDQFSFSHPYLNDGLIIALCEKGNGCIKINFKDYSISENMIIVIHPHSVLEIIEKSADIQLSAFFLSTDLIAELQIIKDFEVFVKITQFPCVMLDKSTMDELIDFYVFIVKQYQSVDFIYKKEISKALFCAFTIKIRSLFKDPVFHPKKKITSRYEVVCDQFIQLVLKHYKEERNIAFYADQLCMTPKYASGLIKKAKGKPMHFWINEVVIMDAKFRLKTTALSVKQIADELNFTNASFFGRFFKEHTGITPLQYRNSN